MNADALSILTSTGSASSRKGTAEGQMLALVIANVARDRETLKGSLLLLPDVHMVHTASFQSALDGELLGDKLDVVVIDADDDATQALALVRRIRACPDGEAVPILLVLRGVRSLMQRQLSNFNVTAILDKPYTPHTLEAAVNQVLPQQEEVAFADGSRSPLTKLSELPLFKDFSRHELLTLVRASGFLQLESGQPVVQRGSRVEGVYVMLQGMAKSIPNSYRMDPVVYKPGDCIGITSLFAGSHHVISVNAEVPSRVMWVPRELILRDNHALAARLVRNSAFLLARYLCRVIE